MYNVDDAIAKIDGYVISISGGGPFVGESKLIKIDEVRRTAAYASIVTSNGVPGSSDDHEPADSAEAGEPDEPEREPVPAPDASDEVLELSEEDGERKVQSNGSTGRRRRGRRGGRRRSRAGGGNGSAS